jgi:hypothetical protein
MSLDKKAILKEIEVLIRSIKVHYDNIENEYRIPTIELELITSKIRKLHEKSIIYNHLHYIEEEQLQSTKRLKLDQLIFKHSAADVTMDKIEIEHKKNELFDTQVKFEAKVSSYEKEIISETVAEVAPVKVVAEEPVKVVAEEPVHATLPVVEMPEINNFTPLKLSSKIGINDRFRFIKNLFAGNGTSMEEAIQEIESCSSSAALNACIQKLKKNYQWNEEDETVIDFMQLVKL